MSRRAKRVLKKRLLENAEEDKCDKKILESLLDAKEPFVETRAPLKQFFDDAYQLLELADINRKLVFHALSWYVGDDVWPLKFYPNDFDLSFSDLVKRIRDVAIRFGWVLLVDHKKQVVLAVFTRAYMDNDLESIPAHVRPDLLTIELEDHSKDPEAKMEEEDEYFRKFLDYDGPAYLCGDSLEKRVVLAVLIMQASSTEMECLGATRDVYKTDRAKFFEDLMIISDTTYVKLCEVIRKEITSKYKIWARYYEADKCIRFLFNYEYYLYKWLKETETRHPTDPFGFKE